MEEVEMQDKTKPIMGLSYCPRCKAETTGLLANGDFLGVAEEQLPKSCPRCKLDLKWEMQAESGYKVWNIQTGATDGRREGN